MRVIDLSLPISSDMPHLPAPLYYRNPSEVKVIATLDKHQLTYLMSMRTDIDPNVIQDYGAMSSRLVMATHYGTHVDAPRHFTYDGIPINEVPLGNLMGECIVLDIPKNACENVTQRDLANAGVNVRSGDIVLIRTSWTEKMWGKPEYWIKMPGFTEDAGDWFLDKKVKAAAFDCFSDVPIFRMDPQPMSLRDLPLHNKLLSHGICLIEFLTNTTQIKKERVYLVAAPLKIAGAEAAPARVIAIEDLI